MNKNKNIPNHKTITISYTVYIPEDKMNIDFVKDALSTANMFAVKRALKDHNLDE